VFYSKAKYGTPTLFWTRTVLDVRSLAGRRNGLGRTRVPRRPNGVWLCVALCGSVWLCMALCGSVWRCVALCECTQSRLWFLHVWLADRSS